MKDTARIKITPTRISCLGHQTSQPLLNALFYCSAVRARPRYWDDGNEPGMYSGKVPALGRTATTTYVGHAFKFISTSTKKLVKICMIKKKGRSDCFLVTLHGAAGIV